MAHGPAAAAAALASMRVPATLQLCILSLPGNDACIDCGASKPEWANVTLGTLVCLTCSGLLRKNPFNTIRGLVFDTLSDEHVARLYFGGNGRCLAANLETDQQVRLYVAALTKRVPPASELRAWRTRITIPGAMQQAQV